jgi:hypothetical protein
VHVRKILHCFNKTVGGTMGDKVTPERDSERKEKSSVISEVCMCCTNGMVLEI